MITKTTNGVITMEALQTEILGWLGYLDRWSVSWQVAFILFVAIAKPFTRRSTSHFKNNPTLAIFLAPITLRRAQEL